jgi:hypothetical protein
MPSATPTAAIRGYDTLLEVETSTGVWAEIAEITRTDPPGIEVERIEVTRLRSLGNAGEYIAGRIQEQTLSFEMNFVPGSTTPNLLIGYANAGQTAVKNWRLTWPNGTVWSFSGFVSRFQPGQTSQNQAITASVAVTLSGGYTTSAAAAPVNSLLPSIAGIAQVGQTLTAIEGQWSGAPTITYQWQANGGSWANISGATSRTYVPIVGQVSQPIRCIVTAINSAAPSGVTATSGATAAVIAA